MNKPAIKRAKRTIFDSQLYCATVPLDLLVSAFRFAHRKVITPSRFSQVTLFLLLVWLVATENALTTNTTAAELIESKAIALKVLPERVRDFLHLEDGEFSSPDQTVARLRTRSNVVESEG